MAVHHEGAEHLSLLVCNSKNQATARSSSTVSLHMLLATFPPRQKVGETMNQMTCRKCWSLWLMVSYRQTKNCSSFSYILFLCAASGFVVRDRRNSLSPNFPNHSVLCHRIIKLKGKSDNVMPPAEGGRTYSLDTCMVLRWRSRFESGCRPNSGHQK